MTTNVIRTFAFLFCVTVAGAAHAGKSCEERKIGPDELRKAMQLGDKTRRIVEGAGAEVAIVGRIGSDLAQHGLRYSHMGALVRDHPQGRWTFVHVLNHCGRADSAVYNEGLANFFLDDPFEYEAVVIVPSLAYQRRLARALLGPAATAMHEERYNMLAHPQSVTYQNSNQWLLELFAVAHAPEGSIATRAEAQAYLASRGYSADPIAVPAFKRLGARLFRANVRLDEHEAKGAYGVYETITVRSMVRFLERIDTPVAKRVVAADRADRDPERY